MKTIAIVGAGYLQKLLVLKAKEMGLRTICFSWEEGAVCKDIADAFYPISVVERDRILDVCRQERIDGVTSIASDVAVPTVAHVANAMGLVGNSMESAYLSTNKYAMRRHLSDAHIPCPSFVEVDEKTDVVRATSSLRYPLIVKPEDRSGSLGVEEVDDSSQIAEAVARARSVSLCGRVIVEECIRPMHEISVEGISLKGEYFCLALTDKMTTGAPFYVEIGHRQPAQMSDELRTRIINVVKMGVDALGICYGATHAELMLTDDGRIFVTEIGARMGGDFIGADLVQLTTGYDFLKGVINCALGTFKKPVIHETDFCAGVWFYTSQTKWVKDIIVHPDECVVRSELQNDTLRTLTCSGDRSGYFIYRVRSCWASGYNALWEHYRAAYEGRSRLYAPRCVGGGGASLVSSKGTRRS